MQVRVLFFGMLKDVAGCSTDFVSLPDGATIRDLLAHYSADAKLQRYLGSVAVSINQEYAASTAALHENDEVALLPPVSGGHADAAQPGAATRVEITRSRLDVAAIAARIRRPEDGAIAVFEGIVRNNSRGRRTLYLDYEAYEGMARKQLEALAAQALQKFQVRELAIAHRLGRLEIGETSVAIVVASGHRGAAFDACRWLIDSLKKTVPIWKKEYFEDGAVWADGEPFPPEVRQL
ncbi:MAG: molybdenum cofactor biosynthesis protein [Terriglobales bacterium]